LKHDQDIALRFSESISDFGMLITEHGAELVGMAFRNTYPEQAAMLYEIMKRPKRQVPALFLPGPEVG
jgi:hypothetical protein